jgi:hypothetical protein
MKRHCSDVNHISPPSRFDADLLHALDLEDIPRNGEKQQESLWKVSVLFAVQGGGGTTTSGGSNETKN